MQDEKMNKLLSSIWNLLTNIENDIKRVKILINKLKNGSRSIEILEKDLKEKSSNLLNYSTPDNWTVVEWIYDWLYMIWSDDKKYPVPLNYSSKSKLISQDILKLTILANGKLMYKLIAPAPRNYIKATLSQADNEYIGIWDDGKTYKLNPAAVSYFWLSIWNEMTIIINWEGKWDFAAIETKL